jgi:hypothetical protein
VGDAQRVPRLGGRRQPDERLRYAVPDDEGRLWPHAERRHGASALALVEEEAGIRSAQGGLDLAQPHAAVVEPRTERKRGATRRRLAPPLLPEGVLEPVQAADEHAAAAQRSSRAGPDPGIAGRGVDDVVRPVAGEPRRYELRKQQLARPRGQRTREVVEGQDRRVVPSGAIGIAERERDPRCPGPRVEVVVDGEEDPH